MKKNYRMSTCEVEADQVGFLRDFVEQIKAASAKATIGLVQSNSETFQYDFKIEKIVIESPGRRITHEKLSYGQKRLLAFLYYLESNEKFVIADELADSFHHQWIETCMKKMEGRQCFLSSQNPILLDYLPIKSADDVHKTFIQCHLVKEGDEEYMEWKNTPIEEAERFYKDLEVGIQYVSELLMVRGLW